MFVFSLDLGSQFCDIALASAQKWAVNVVRESGLDYQGAGLYRVEEG